MEQVKESVKLNVVTGPYTSRHGYEFWVIRDTKIPGTRVGSLYDGIPGEFVTWLTINDFVTTPVWLLARMVDAYFTIPDDMLKD